MAANAKPGRAVRPALVLGALLLAAIVVRVIFLVQIEKSELGNFLSLDSRFYRELAGGIAAGAKLPAGAITFNPLYPLFLGVTFRIFGDGLLAPRIIQLVLGILTIVLVYSAGAKIVGGPRKGRLSGGAVAAIAAAMALLYAQFILYEGMILSTGLEVFLLAAAFALALSLDGDLAGERMMKLGSRRIPPWLSSALLGALCGIGSLGRPNLFLLLVVALPVWLILRSRRKRRGIHAAASCIIGAAIFLAPAIAYNAVRTGRFVPVTTHGGINFYIGNRSGADGLFRPPNNMRTDMRGMIEDAKAMAEAEAGHSMTQPDVSDYFFHKALGDIRGNPGAWLRLIGRKLILFFNGAEVPDVPSVFFLERSCGIIKLLFLPFALIAPLGVCGLVVLFRSGRNRSVVSLFLGCVIVSILPFFVNARYRLLAVPILILLAAFFITWVAREISRKRFRIVAVMAAAAIAIFFLVSHRTMAKINQSAAYAMLGNYFAANKNDAKAMEAFAEAYRLDPEHTEAIINYARILLRHNRLAESADLYARAYDRMPRFPRLALEYGYALELLGRREDAGRLYQETFLKGETEERVLACKLLAQSALAAGERDEAISWIRRALDIAPQDSELVSVLERIKSGR
jgi:4-amino-4-deoxy-L-arabinose transferase-like glycosyltransferase